MKDDLKNFDVLSNIFNFTSAKKMNIKRVIYRSITLFVSALGRLNGVREHSSFGIIEELKRRNELSKTAAQKLSLAVAVACHIRLVHYSSKNRQDDDIYKEDEFEGRRKFQELTKVVNPMWLIDSLSTAQVLQQHLSLNLHIQSFSQMLALNRVNAPLSIMGLFGLYDLLIAVGTHTLSSTPVLSPYDCNGLVLVCTAYMEKREHEKCLETLNILKKKLVKQPQAVTNTLFELEMYDNLDKFMTLTEAQSLLRVGKCSLALSKTNELMKRQLATVTLITCLKCKIRCTLMLNMFNETLSSIRDILKIYREHHNLFQGGFDPDMIRYITFSLLGLGRKQQAVHWAQEGFHFVTEYAFTDFYVELFNNLVKEAKQCSGLQMQLYRN